MRQNVRTVFLHHKCHQCFCIHGSNASGLQSMMDIHVHRTGTMEQCLREDNRNRLPVWRDKERTWALYACDANGTSPEQSSCAICIICRIGEGRVATKPETRCKLQIANCKFCTLFISGTDALPSIALAQRHRPVLFPAFQRPASLPRPICFNHSRPHSASLSRQCLAPQAACVPLADGKHDTEDESDTGCKLLYCSRNRRDIWIESAPQMPCDRRGRRRAIFPSICIFRCGNPYPVSTGKAFLSVRGLRKKTQECEDAYRHVCRIAEH